MSCDPEDHERVIAQHCAQIDEHQREHKRRGERIADLEATLADRDRRIAELEAENHTLTIRRREGRNLLRRMVKYVREDGALTPGFTRLQRCADQVADYLSRTAEPSDWLRASGRLKGGGR